MCEGKRRANTTMPHFAKEMKIVAVCEALTHLFCHPAKRRDLVYSKK
jgi:hypothetical protein